MMLNVLWKWINFHDVHFCLSSLVKLNLIQNVTALMNILHHKISYFKVCTNIYFFVHDMYLSHKKNVVALNITSIGILFL